MSLSENRYPLFRDTRQESDLMTVLVTGGAGYIGSQMVNELRDAGEPVVVLDNLSTGHRGAIPDGVPLIVGETGDQPLVSKLIRELRSWCRIRCAIRSAIIATTPPIRAR
jgi:UDP-glucose 4-epimerase